MILKSSEQNCWQSLRSVVCSVGAALLWRRYYFWFFMRLPTKLHCYGIRVVDADGTIYGGAYLGTDPDDVCKSLMEWMPGCKILRVEE